MFIWREKDAEKYALISKETLVEFPRVLSTFLARLYVKNNAQTTRQTKYTLNRTFFAMPIDLHCKIPCVKC